MCISLRKKTPTDLFALFILSSSTISVLSRSVVVCIDLRWAWWLKCIFHFPVYSFPSLFSSHSLRTPSTLQPNHLQSLYFCFSL